MEEIIIQEDSYSEITESVEKNVTSDFGEMSNQKSDIPVANELNNILECGDFEESDNHESPLPAYHTIGTCYAKEYVKIESPEDSSLIIIPDSAPEIITSDIAEPQIIIDEVIAKDTNGCEVVEEPVNELKVYVTEPAKTMTFRFNHGNDQYIHLYTKIGEVPLGEYFPGQGMRVPIYSLNISKVPIVSIIPL